MTSHELLLALADEDTLELARRMIGKPRLAFLLAEEAIGPEGETSLDVEAVAQILGVHKRHAYRLIKSHGWGLKGYTPFSFIKFLDHCAKLILLKKVGGGYIFIHRMLLEYFAELDLTKQKITRKV